MPAKPKVRRSPRKARETRKEKAQSERFIEAARVHGVDETGGEFERALRKIVPPRRGAKPSS